jgi:hypothetical protein
MFRWFIHNGVSRDTFYRYNNVMKRGCMEAFLGQKCRDTGGPLYLAGWHAHQSTA